MSLLEKLQKISPKYCEPEITFGVPKICYKINSKVIFNITDSLTYGKIDIRFRQISTFIKKTFDTVTPEEIHKRIIKLIDDNQSIIDYFTQDHNDCQQIINFLTPLIKSEVFSIGSVDKNSDIYRVLFVANNDKNTKIRIHFDSSNYLFTMNTNNIVKLNLEEFNYFLKEIEFVFKQNYIKKVLDS